MERIPGFETETSGADLVGWITSLYKLSMWIVGICALFMITIGGFTYMTSAGNTSTAGTGKKIITDAVIGLILALVAVLLFTVINPNLTTVNLQITPVSTSTTPATPTGTVAPGGSTTPPSSSSQAAAAKILSNPNITDETGNCSSASGIISPKTNLTQTSNGEPATACNSACTSGTPCTGQTNLNLKLLNAIDSLSVNYKPLVVVSLAGGAHSATSTHYAGQGADLKPTTNKSSWDGAVAQLNGMGCHAACDNNGDTTVSCSDATHVHVTCS